MAKMPAAGIPPDKIEPIAPKFWETVSSALVPHHPRGTGCRGIVVSLESQRFLAEHVSLETPPSLEPEVVERTADAVCPGGNRRACLVVVPGSYHRLGSRHGP